jgi:hypothetical protein
MASLDEALDLIKPDLIGKYKEFKPATSPGWSELPSLARNSGLWLTLRH